MDKRLEKENEYFEKNQAALGEKYLGQYIVIKGEKVLDVFDTALSAGADESFHVFADPG